MIFIDTVLYSLCGLFGLWAIGWWLCNEDLAAEQRYWNAHLFLRRRGIKQTWTF